MAAVGVPGGNGRSFSLTALIMTTLVAIVVSGGGVGLGALLATKDLATEHEVTLVRDQIGDLEVQVARLETKLDDIGGGGVSP